MPTGKARKISRSAEVAVAFCFVCVLVLICLFAYLGLGFSCYCFGVFFEIKTMCFISNFGHFRENHS